MNRNAIGVFSGFRRKVVENCALLGYYVASFGYPTLDVTDRLFRNFGKKLLLAE